MNVIIFEQYSSDLLVLHRDIQFCGRNQMKMANVSTLGSSYFNFFIESLELNPHQRNYFGAVQMKFTTLAMIGNTRFQTKVVGFRDICMGYCVRGVS